jgi:hypothetical protein
MREQSEQAKVTVNFLQERKETLQQKEKYFKE